MPSPLLQAYCFKCRAIKEMKDARQVTTKNGRLGTRGVCPSCGTAMFRMARLVA
ncbi:MAG: DUF5679 domain-containing protein [Chloroflexota bacterium]|nr:DUF5679 domain-containing protein [Chloroflexota bacterium]